MPGRRRRGSTSSVDAPNRKPTHWCQESSVLRAPSPGTSEDDWPIFELVDAVVLNRDGKTMANALDVLYEGPFIVRGNMIIDDAEQKRHLIMRPKPSYPLEIFSCSRYSVGEAEPDDQDVDESRTTKPPVVWVGGRGAWFELQPSAAYLPIYRDMCEAIRLYYAIYDIYQEEGVKKLNRTSKSTDPAERLSKIFLQYAIKAGNGLTVEEVVQRCRDLAPFLITQFLQAKGDDEAFWKSTWFYRWLQSENEDLFKKAAHAIHNPPTINPSVQLPSRNKRDSTSVSNRTTRASESIEPAPSKRARRSGSGTATALDSAVKTSDGSEKAVSRTRSTRSRSIVQPQPQSEPEPEPGPRLKTGSKPSEVVGPPEKSKSISVPDGDESGDILEIVQEMCDNLAQQKKGKGVNKVKVLNNLYFTYRFPTYKKGGPGCHRIPVEEVLHYHAATLLKSLDASSWGENDFYPWLQEVSRTELMPEAFKLSDLPFPLVPRKKNPGQHRTSNAAPADVVKVGDVHIPDDMDEDNSSNNQFSTPKRRGKGVKTPGRLSKSVLRPAASSKKRPRPDTDSDSDLDGRDPKRSHYFSDADDSMDDADLSGAQLKAEEEEDKIKIAIRADRIPSATPCGPNGTWVCDQDDCNYIVRGGDAEECQRRIQEHFQEHEQQTERVQLAVTESRGHLPINHLLDKIKNLGDAAELDEKLSVGGVELPKPIQRKLLV